MDLEVGHVNLARGFRGGERQTELLIRALSERGVAQRLVTRRVSALADRLADHPAVRIHRVPWPYLPFAFRIAGCDVIHGHDGKAPAFAAWAGRLGSAPVVLTRRIQRPPGRGSLSSWRGATALVGLSRSVAEALDRATGRNDTRVIPSAHARLPVDPAVAGRLRARWGDRFVAVCPAQLVAGQKGQEHLIEAARRLDGTGGRAVHVVLLGRGPGEAHFRDLARGLESVEFGGFVDNVGDFLEAADALVLPSLHEGLGSVILDAFAAGLPVVASDIPGIRDVVEHETTGLLVPPADPVPLAAALARLRDDDVLRGRLGEAGRRASTDYAPERMAERYLAVYREVVG